VAPGKFAKLDALSKRNGDSPKKAGQTFCSDGRYQASESIADLKDAVQKQGAVKYCHVVFWCSDSIFYRCSCISVSR